MVRAPFLIEAMAKEGRMLVNPAAHVDFDGQASGLPTNSTIAWTTLRVAHRIHKPATTIFSGRSTSKPGISEEFTFQR